MKIRYKKKQLNINLFLGVAWTLLGLLGCYYSDNVWLDYGNLGIGVLYLCLYYYQYKYKYLTIENGIIKQNWPFGKKLHLDKVKQIKLFAGDYILKTDTEELSINSQMITSESLTVLNEELSKLGIKWS